MCYILLLIEIYTYIYIYIYIYMYIYIYSCNKYYSTAYIISKKWISIHKMININNFNLVIRDSIFKLGDTISI